MLAANSYSKDGCQMKMQRVIGERVHGAGPRESPWSCFTILILGSADWLTLMTQILRETAQNMFRFPGPPLLLIVVLCGEASGAVMGRRLPRWARLGLAVRVCCCLQWKENGGERWERTRSRSRAWYRLYDCREEKMEERERKMSGPVARVCFWLAEWKKWRPNWWVLWWGCQEGKKWWESRGSGEKASSESGVVCFITVVILIIFHSRKVMGSLTGKRTFWASNHTHKGHNYGIMGLGFVWKRKIEKEELPKNTQYS